MSIKEAQNAIDSKYPEKHTDDRTHCIFFPKEKEKNAIIDPEKKSFVKEVIPNDRL